MCGILGLFRTGSATTPISEELLTKMRDTMCHRGPDDAGLFISPAKEIGFAFRRLAIIDLSPTASQPMRNEDDSVVLIFNGEIYNHAEIRPQLQALGCRFKTDHSDTEVILRGYEKWGEDVLPRLRGMFAFAIWDKKKKKVWIARDRMGVKPLYYTFNAGHFMFASEIKALLAFPGLKREVDSEAFYDFLTFLVSPAPKTLFKGIFKLPASHTMTVYEDGRIEQKRYWNPFFELEKAPQLTESDWTSKILSQLRESIRYRMVSDVKFGVFLSGGIDSSANVALMAELMNRPVETFSIGYKDNDKLNELGYARMIAERYKTNHHEVIIDSSDLVKFLPQLIYHQDEPIVDPVCVPVYFVSKLARENGTIVCQVGEGSDELFCGYPSWGQVLDWQGPANAYRALPTALKRLLYSGAETVFGSSSKNARKLDLIRRLTEGEEFFWGGAEAYQETLKKKFLKKSFISTLKGYTSAEPLRALRKDFESDAIEGADDLHWMSYLDLRLRLPELLLMRVDKMTMATSLEARVPFLDQEFVRMAMSIPQGVKYKDKTLKYILKKAVEPVLPREIIYRKKQGFAVPVEQWFQDKLQDWSESKIMEFAKRTDYFEPAALQSYLDSQKSKNTWFLLNFVLWHEHWIEGRAFEPPRES